MREMDIKLRNRDMTDGRQSSFRVGIYPVPGFALMSYASTVEPLRAANLLARENLYELTHFASDEPAASSSGAEVGRACAVGDIVDLDLLLVVAGGDPFAFEDAATLDWLRQMAGHVPKIGGVSGGPVILARAGLMEGRRLTVHWEHAAELSEAHPELIIERRLYVNDRDRMTCGGGTAPIDMMHALIAGHHGTEFARLVSDWFLHTDIRAAASPQRGLPSADLGVASPHVVAAVAAMENHVGDPLTLKHLALTTGVSDRQLNRLFTQTFGQSAMAYYRNLRLEVGRRLVTGSAMPLHAIAEATGFATAAHFSNQYLQRFGLRPRADRVGTTTG